MSSTLLDDFNKHIWQPFTQMKLIPEPVFIESGKGSKLTTRDGQELVDAIGSWWVNIHGHAHPTINRAIKDQLDKLEHVIFAGLSHEPGVELATRLSSTTQGYLPRVYYSDNGSTAVEIALKMAYQYFWNKGETNKNKFLSLNNGYHGDTIGTMSVGARSLFHEAYANLLFDTIYTEPPAVDFSDLLDEPTALAKAKDALNQLEQILQNQADSICAFILEPIVQGASGGFAMYPPAYLKEASILCKAHNVFLIADEVFTGYGRTGTFYACEQASIWPDILAVSKGLSGGYLPFAATLCSEEIYQGFYSDDRSHTLFHGHSMTGNPLGCAAALASLDIFEQEDTLNKVKYLETQYKEYAVQLKSGPLAKHIAEIRILGSIFVLELAGDGNYASEFGWQVMSKAIQKGVLIRPLGKSVYLTPPYCINRDELDLTFKVMQEVLLELL